MNVVHRMLTLVIRQLRQLKMRTNSMMYFLIMWWMKCVLYWDNSREGWGMSIMNEKKFGRILETGMGFIMSWVLNTSAMYLLGAPMTPATVFPA